MLRPIRASRSFLIHLTVLSHHRAQNRWFVTSSSFSLDTFQHLTNLELERANPQDLKIILPQISELSSLRRFRIDGRSVAAYPKLELAAHLPPSLPALRLTFDVAPSDILELVQDPRFDACRVT